MDNKYDKNGHELAYRLVETKVMYAYDTSWRTINRTSSDELLLRTKVDEIRVEGPDAAREGGEDGTEGTPGVSVNINKIPVGSVTAVKTFVDEGNRDGKRDLALELYIGKHTNREATGTIAWELYDKTPVVAKSDNAWTYTWTNLPIYEDFKTQDKDSDDLKFVYVVKEKSAGTGGVYKLISYAVNGNIVMVTENNKETAHQDEKLYLSPDPTLRYLVATDEAGAKVDILNSYVPERFTIKATKAWKDDSNAYGTRPLDEKVTLTLLADDGTDTPKAVTQKALSAITVGSQSFAYYMEGTPEPSGQTASAGAGSGTDSQDGAQIDTGSGTSANAGATHGIPNNHDAFTTSEAAQSIVEKGSNEVTEGEGKNTAVWQNLPVWRWQKKAGSEEYEAVQIKYYVQETHVNGYTTTYAVTPCEDSGQNASSSTDPVSVDARTSEILGVKDKTASAAFTNTLERTSLTLTKAWADDNYEKEKVRPQKVDFEIQYRKGRGGWTDFDMGASDSTVSVAAAQGSTGFDVTKSGHTISIISNPVTSALPDSPSVVVSNLPKAYASAETVEVVEYRVREAKIYYATTNGESTTYTEVSPGSSSNYNSETQEGTDHNGKTWTAAFGTYDNTTTTARKEGDGNWTSTSTNTRDTVTFAATKVWNDANNRDGKRSAVTLQLYRDGTDEAHKFGDPVELPIEGSSTTTIEGVTVNISGKIVTWTNLPKYKNEAKVQTKANISYYSVKEVQMAENAASYTTNRPSGATGDKVPASGLDQGASAPTPTPDATSGNFTDDVTNIHTPESFTIEATKTWSDGGNKYGQRPEAVHLKLIAKTKASAEEEYAEVQVTKDVTNTYLVPKASNGAGVYTTSEVTQTLCKASGEETRDSWAEKASWENLPVMANGYPIRYEVVETLDAEGNTVGAPKNYEMSVNYNEFVEGTNGTTQNVSITNTHKNEVTVTAVKEWKIGGETKSADDIAAFPGNYLPTSVTVQLQVYDGTSSQWKDVPGGEAVLPENNTWSHSWINLDKVDETSETEYKYRAVEKSITYGTGNDAVTYGVSDGRVGAFTYTESHPAETVSGTFISTLANNLELVSLSLTKIWQGDENDRYGTRPDSLAITIEDRMGTEEISDDVKFVDSKWTNPTWTKENQGVKSDRWTATVNGLPKYRARKPASATEWPLAAYTVGETSCPDGYEVVNEQFSLAQGSSSDQSIHERTMTNKLETVSLSITKHWYDYDDTFHTRPKSSEDQPMLELTLTDSDGKIYKVGGVGSDYPVTYSWNENGNGSEWTAEVSNLPKYKRGTKTEMVYKVAETTLSNYYDSASDFVAGSYFDTTASVVTSVSTDGLTATSGTYAMELRNPVKTTSLTIEKSFVGDIPADLMPSKITFLVEWWDKKGGTNQGGAWVPYKEAPVSTTDGTIELELKDANKVAESASVKWSRTINNLPYLDKDGAYIQYRVSETKLTYVNPDGEVTITGGSFAKATEGSSDESDRTKWTASTAPFAESVTMTEASAENLGYKASAVNTMETTKVKATKTWQDNSNRDNVRPGYLELTLFRGGNEEANEYKVGGVSTRKTVHGDAHSNTNWTAEWEELPKYSRNTDNGTVTFVESIYHIVETGYKAKESDSFTTIQGEAGVGTDYLAPTYAPASASAQGTDSEISLGVTNKLNSVSKSFTINAYKTWHEILANLTPGKVVFKLKARVTSNGSDYTVQDVLKWSGPNVKGYLDPEYSDSHDAVYTTSDPTQPLTVNSHEDWKNRVATWENLPISAHGYPIQYYIEETEPLGYSYKVVSTADGYTAISGEYNLVTPEQYASKGITADAAENGKTKYVILENQPGTELPSTGIGGFGSRNDIYMMSLILLAGAAFVYILKRWSRAREMEEMP